VPHRALDPRITEHRNPRSANIDLATPLEIVDIMTGDRRVLTRSPRSANHRQPISRIEHAFRTGGRLFYVGAGTSGRLGILDASECPPTFGSDPELVQGIIAGGTEAVFRAQEGAEDSPEQGATTVDEYGINAHDVLIGIAASGTTPFVRGALTRAKARGAAVGLIACTPIDEAFASTLDHLIVPVTGPELVTGSTRLKAGTATKLVLNMLTTGAMIRVGKTFGNLMVDLRATNLKLVDRSQRIIMEVCHVTVTARSSPAPTAVKLAIVMHLLASTGRGRGGARQGDGVIRRVVGGDPTHSVP
jgi:N-acetylmuramic acid 6-phosphate etherase